MDGDVSGVRIIPPLLEFKDSIVNHTYTIEVTVKNVSHTSKAIRYYGPNSKCFKLKVKNPEKPIAAGLEVPAFVEYRVTSEEEKKDRLVLTVDDDVIQIPIIGSPVRPQLCLRGPVNFGNIVAKSKVVVRETVLSNTGSKAGEFKIKYAGDKPLAIVPSSGTVPPKSEQIIKVEYVAKTPGSFDEIAKVKLEGQEVNTLQILGNITEGQLELLTYDKEINMECVKFNPTYYGTDQTESAVLFNNSPDPVCFVAVLDEDALGQELGVDLTKSTAATIAANNDKALQQSGQTNSIGSMFTCIPNQGMLAPYEKIPLFFRFSPRWNPSEQGFRSNQKAAPRKDFAIFLQLNMVGAKDESGDDDKKNEGTSLEIALTGTAMPVLLHLSPQTDFDFGECPVGQHVDYLCTLKNDSKQMALSYQFRRVAHFVLQPPSGKISPGHTQDVIISFAPKQVGTFNPIQYIDVIGQLADDRNPFLMHLKVIHSIPMALQGISDPITIKKEPAYNSGITPLITNEVGMNLDLLETQAKKGTRAALLKGPGTKLHKIKGTSSEPAFVAFPNDRPASIRPSKRGENYKTVFTGQDRHNYVDPDYSYTDQEMMAVNNHKKSYVSFISNSRDKRIRKQRNKEFGKFDNETDMGTRPAKGLKPRTIKLDELGAEGANPAEPNANFRLLSTKKLHQEEVSCSTKVMDGLNAVPTTSEEKADCKKALTPQQLHQIVIGPPTIDFGQVCLKSMNQKEFHMVNNLDQYIHINVIVDCRELRQTSPLSQVVPPKCKAILPLIFESNSKGRFQRSLDYTINGFYKNHFTVFAEVVPVSLEMSTDELVLEPQAGLPAEAGFRGVITLKNKLNHPADFTWAPILGERGTAFSIRPATGTVDGEKDLDCEVVFHPSMMAPEEGMFALQIHGGNKLKLRCKAKFGTPSVSFIDRRIMFGQVPLNLPTVRTALLKNNGVHHAYFGVMDPFPFPGMSISPVSGVVPVGGHAEVKITLNPDAIIKFDTRVQVEIRNGKTQELRMGGTVEAPSIELELPKFEFAGVFCGSTKTMSFKLISKAFTRARLEIDLSKYKDFTIAFPKHVSPEDYSFSLMNPGLYSVTVDSEEVVEGLLTFTPTEVASYDFILPVTINKMEAPTPESTPFPPTPAPSQKNSVQHIINPRPIHVTIATPRKRVLATALRQPLQLSQTTLEFSLTPTVHELASNAGLGCSENIVFVNNIDRTLRWDIDTRHGNEVLQEGVFKFLHKSGVPYASYDGSGVGGDLEPGQTFTVGVLFCPTRPGTYEVTVPIILESEFSAPYQYLTLRGELKHPKLQFDPLTLVLTPVPLDTEVAADFSIIASEYTRTIQIEAHVPEVECDDGSVVTPLSIEFPRGQEIVPRGEEAQILPCRLIFNSSKPVSFCQPVTFTDNDGGSFPLLVTATADNCLMTCYPFLAQHRHDHQIICERGLSLRGRKTASKESIAAGEAVLVPCEDPFRSSSRPSTTATSSNFEVSSSSYEGSSQSVTESTYPSTPREGALNKFSSESEQQTASRGRNLASRSLGSALFPDEDSEEGLFHADVLQATQRWFSSQGWAGGPHPIVIPYSTRTGLSRKPREEKIRNGKGEVVEPHNVKKEFKTIYDMIHHLSGKPVPGIPINNPLPAEAEERVKQVYWQHSTLLTFLRSQGACLASIKPEYLMDPRDYKRWAKLQREIEEAKHRSGHWDRSLKTEEEEALEDELFEAVSKRAWTDILLQLLKTLVLAKITPRNFKNLPSPFKRETVPQVDPNPLCSNVYNIGERIILLWLNHSYEQMRHALWDGAAKGGVPPSRWIVNFDFDLLDGLVLAAVLGAHMPFLVESHLRDMYTHPTSSEQCLHNALKVVNAMRCIGIDYDIQAIDITDPNPIALLLLCVHLYNNLPQYLPKSSVEFSGALHTNVLRQVKLTNPSNKPLVYTAILGGRDARDFSLPKGDVITIAPRSEAKVTISFVSRFLRPCEAVLVLVGRRQGASVGSTLVFNLRTLIDRIMPRNVVHCESACYELHKVNVSVVNPFPEGGTFRVVLMEMDTPSSEEALVKPKKKKSKKITSKIDCGSKRLGSEVEEEIKVDVPRQSVDAQEEGASTMSAFSCQTKTVELEANGPGSVDIHFLPFNLGKRACSVIFIHEQIGEFLYQIDALAVLPLTSEIPFEPSDNDKSSSRITSAVAANTGRGMFGGNDHVVYLKGTSGKKMREEIFIPVTNAARENALIKAAALHMTDLERERRRVTGTLQSGTITAETLKTLLGSKQTHTMPTLLKKIQKKGTKFSVEFDSPFFSGPKSLVIPNPSYEGNSPQRTGRDGTVGLPLSFLCDTAGHYPCTVVLNSPDDVRVFKVECTVMDEGAEAQIEFEVPVHQSVSQDIPIINETDHDWYLNAFVEGIGFGGPGNLMVRSKTTQKYPLTFNAPFEGVIKGKLMIKNTSDRVDHVFHLTGHGQKPLPLDRVSITCNVKDILTQSIEVPNATRNKLYYRVECDVPFLSGPSHISVLGAKSSEYKFKVAPLRHGSYSGVISFVAGDNPVKEVDSDGEEVVEDSNDKFKDHVYRVWYTVDLEVCPPPPVKSLQMSCPCQRKAALEIGVSNPLNREITLEVEVSGDGVAGPTQLTLPPKERTIYELVYFPAIRGQTEGSLTFYHEAVGEFWYHLTLIGEAPVPTKLGHMECELGRWTEQKLTLANPTKETLELVPTISNTNNFLLERETLAPIVLKPHATIHLPLKFFPSTLGDEDHQSTITFHSEQLGEWMFTVSGTGMIPQPQDPVSVVTKTGSNTTLIIPFRNPLDVTVLATVELIDKYVQTKKAIEGDETIPVASPFTLLLKNIHNVRIGPKSSLEVPVSFSPEKMHMCEAMCKITVRRENGKPWQYSPANEITMTDISRKNDTGMHSISWVYPIHGYPESGEQDSQPTVIACQARERFEERLEVSLSGVAPSSGGQKRGVHARAVTPNDQAPKIPEGIVVGEVLAVADEFTYELIYGDKESKNLLESSVALTLVRQHRDKKTGLVVLIFNVVFSPYKPIKQEVNLMVKGATGGIWKYPIQFVASEPEPDDTIIVEAVGLNKPSSIGFRLNSQTRYPESYQAFFVAGSDLEFGVTPAKGELFPLGTDGTRIQIDFCPTKYGKIYQGKLVVHTSDMQWTYNVRGVLPDYVPPRGYSSLPMRGHIPADPRKRGESVNYVRENLKLTATAVSSPIKGAPILGKGRQPSTIIY